MRMTAAVMYEQGLPTPYLDSTPFRIEDVELDGAGEGEVLVEIRAAGLCHSDLSRVAGLRKRKLPVVGGHEGAGIVREVGRGVTRLKPGDHVVMTVANGSAIAGRASTSNPLFARASASHVHRVCCRTACAG
jgi:Zn-dependent alcohol dehydrogenase